MINYLNNYDLLGEAGTLLLSFMENSIFITDLLLSPVFWSFLAHIFMTIFIVSILFVIVWAVIKMVIDIGTLNFKKY